jgi:hypothetical protein
VRWLLPFFVLTALAGDEARFRIVREGVYWTRVDQGQIHLPPSASIHVVSPGKVTARGESRQGASYEIKRRVKAAGFAQAWKLLSAPPLRVIERAGTTQLTIFPGAAGQPLPELDLRLPSSMRHSFFEVQDGSVNAFDLDSGVSVESRSGAVVLDHIRAGVSVKTGGGEIRLGSVVGRIRCYSGGGGIVVERAGSDSVLETAGGEIWVREAAGPLLLTTGGGNIQVLRAGSSVNAHSSGGLVDVNQARGVVRATTDAGAIQVGAAPGVECRSLSGAIRLYSVSGALRASTRMGSIIANLTAGRVENSYLDTASGDITVLMPSNLSITVQAASEAAGRMGRIFSEFPEIRIRSGAWWTLLPQHAEGAINGGGPLLKLSAAGGVIQLRRQR